MIYVKCCFLTRFVSVSICTEMDGSEADWQFGWLHGSETQSDVCRGGRHVRSTTCVAAWFPFPFPFRQRRYGTCMLTAHRHPSYLIFGWPEQNPAGTDNFRSILFWLVMVLDSRRNHYAQRAGDHISQNLHPLLFIYYMKIKEFICSNILSIASLIGCVYSSAPVFLKF